MVICHREVLVQAGIFLFKIIIYGQQTISLEATFHYLGYLHIMLVFIWKKDVFPAIIGQCQI